MKHTNLIHTYLLINSILLLNTFVWCSIKQQPKNIVYQPMYRVVSNFINELVNNNDLVTSNYLDI